MNKRLFLTLFLLPILIGGVAVTGAFASGQSEEPAQPYGRRAPWQDRGYAERPAPTFSEETRTVTGRLYFANRIHPELKSGTEEIQLLVPRYYLYEAELTEGQTVTVEGYTVSGMPRFPEESAEAVRLWVTKAVIDGQEYDLERYGRGPMRGGPMMGTTPRDPRWHCHPWGRGRGFGDTGPNPRR